MEKKEAQGINQREIIIISRTRVSYQDIKVMTGVTVSSTKTANTSLPSTTTADVAASAAAAVDWSCSSI